MPATPVAHVLLVTSHHDDARSIRAFLEQRGHHVESVDDGEKAFNRLDTRLFDVLVAELDLGKRSDGLRLMEVAHARNPDTCVILLTDETGLALATQGMRTGAADFQTRPLNLDKLEAVLLLGMAHQRLVREQFALKRQLDEQYGLGNVVGNSRQMIQVYSALRQAAPRNMPILLQGEGGTGKDLIAHALHTNSQRKNEAFVKLNCGRIAEKLIEGELFGYVAGAFEGACQSSPGRLELADQGTLFLDDVDRLPLSVQDKLLRVVRTGHFERLGDTRTLRVDVRLMAAANGPLKPLVEEERFRETLWKALADTTIELAALRERREDIPLLVDHLLERVCRETGRVSAGVTRNAMDLLRRYDWPGNVRELHNILEGMVLTGRAGHALDVNDVPAHIRQRATPKEGEIRVPTGATMAEVERITIQETMKACGYDKKACAKTLAIGLRTLYRKLKEYEG